MSDLFYPVEEVTAEMEVKKSKFISIIFPFSDEEKIREKLKSLKREHKNAAHLVHAFVIGSKNSIVKGMSDDGEPSGTAGKPVLSILEGNGYTNILVVVVRYFGGIKLGTGGLVKAYSDSANLAIKKARFVKLVNEKRLRLSFSYEHHGIVSALVKSTGARVEKEEFLDHVSIEVALKEDDADQFMEKVKDLTSGCVDVGEI